MKEQRKITAVMAPFRKSSWLFAPCLALVILTACGDKQLVDDLAVAKMPRSEMQATSYLPLNADKPGAFVTVQNYLVPGKYTVVEFFSPYDGVSAQLEPWLIQLTQAKREIAVRTVNVNRTGVQGIDWQSPVLDGQGITKLPYFQIYDPAQTLRAQNRPAYEQVSQWVQSLQQGGSTYVGR